MLEDFQKNTLKQKQKQETKSNKREDINISQKQRWDHIKSKTKRK